ncbi:hypothetical protein [Kribbella caucasensis]|nr:hypothetical protein [Kribbella sp. VKM Ac-2527]
MTDWRAVLAATVSHLRWLRVRLGDIGRTRWPAKVSDNSLGRLAQAIGAGADLLAMQAPSTASVLDDRDDLVAARAEVAAIALIAARGVKRQIPRATPEYRRLLALMVEFEMLARSDVRRAGLGALGCLTAGAPSAPADALSSLARSAARWERAHASAAPLTLLTRDLRSATAQLRTVCCYTSHLAAHLLAAPTADLDAGQQLDLKTLEAGLRAFEDGAIRVAMSWHRRLSDLSGQSNTPGEIASLDLQAALDRAVRPEGRLLRPEELVPNRRIAMGLLDAMDELVWSADQVARKQQYAVAGLILEGRLFVPRHEVAKLDLQYLRRPGGGSRPLQPRWVSSNLPIYFEDLTDALAWSAGHLTASAGVARRLAGTSHQARPAGDEPMRVPAPYLDVPNRTRRTTPMSTRIADPGQDPLSSTVEPPSTRS